MVQSQPRLNMNFTDLLISRTKLLSSQCKNLKFSFDGYIYNPLDYAWNCHEAFLRRYVKQGAKALFLGMNPGPFGMMQTGVPFGEINAVLNYLDIHEVVNKPENEHPNRPVLGLDIKRSEVSGQRIWSLIASRYPNRDFADDIAVFNYCPLGFLMNTKTAKNETPDHLAKEERKALEDVCTSYLKDIIELVNPHFLIGVGKYAEAKLVSVNEMGTRKVFSIIHPSPGNPMANNNWAGKTSEKLISEGLWK